MATRAGPRPGAATRWVTRLGFAIAVVGSACAPEGSVERPLGDDVPRTEPLALPTPELRVLGDSTFWLVPSIQAGELAAYVSRAEHRVYVARPLRDRVRHILNAHISVSTGHWRIPLPGDDLLEPLTPGAPEREFEELSLDAWDATTPPAVGDFRVVRGGARPVLVTSPCVEVDGSVESGTGAPLRVEVVDRTFEGVTREDFVVVGSATGSEGCARPAGPAAMWTVHRGQRPATQPSG